MASGSTPRTLVIPFKHGEKRVIAHRPDVGAAGRHRQAISPRLPVRVGSAQPSHLAHRGDHGYGLTVQSQRIERVEEPADHMLLVDPHQRRLRSTGGRAGEAPWQTDTNRIGPDDPTRFIDGAPIPALGCRTREVWRWQKIRRRCCAYPQRAQNWPSCTKMRTASQNLIEKNQFLTLSLRFS